MTTPFHDLAAPLLAGAGLRIAVCVALAGIAFTVVFVLGGFRR
ncbi:hypothetical protein [Streptomyces naganishii]|nr:hypothetical protein [Streptomyces naganishii]